MVNLIEHTYAITAAQIGNTIVLNTSTLSLGNLITLIISWILYITGILAFIFLVYAGILYITAGGNPDQARRAQMGLINAIIGIIIVVLSYAILRAVVVLALGGSFFD